MDQDHEQRSHVIEARTFCPSMLCQNCGEVWFWKQDVEREGLVTIHVFCSSCGSVPINQMADELLATKLAGAVSPLLSLSELARGLRVSEGTIKHYLKTGKLTALSTVFGDYMVKHESLARLVSPATLVLASLKRLERVGS